MRLLLLTLGFGATFSTWAEIDKEPVINFDKQIPEPALRFPFTLDPFQKRAIMRVERG